MPSAGYDSVFPRLQATIQKLLTEGVQYNSPPAPDKITEASVSEADPNWIIYR